MCTVTFIPGKDSIFFTSNRDEKRVRTDAAPPAAYEFSSGKIMYPKDGNAGGTWIAAHENGNVIVFLNGGWKAHVSTPPYRKSRGLILLDLADHHTPFNCFLAINLNNIEPFTAIIYDNHHLFECRWDGSRKHATELDPSAKYIWSSCTLYNDEVINRRNSWFEEWLTRHPEPSQKDILLFHQFTGDGDIRNGLLMNRNNEMFTVSITSVEHTSSGISMEYVDIKNKESYSRQLSFETSTAGR